MYKKFASLCFTAGMLALVCLGAVLAPAAAVASPCTNVSTRFVGVPATNCLLPPLPLQMSNPINVSVVDGFPNSYLKATLSNVPPGYSLSNGVYLDWCVDYRGPIPEAGPLLQPIIYASSGPLPAHLANTNWNKINYILNHKQGGYTNIQAAIWHFIGGPIPSGDPVFAPANQTAATSNMIAAAEAYGAAYLPGPGEVTALIMDLGANLQLNIIEVVCTGPIEVCIGGHLTICTTNTGSGQLAYMWFKNGLAIPGASSECLSLSNLTAADTGAYCIKVSNACSAVTNCLQLNVTNTLDNTPPVIVCAPNRTYECFGQVPPTPDLGVVTATDNSGMVTLEFAGQTITTNGCQIVIVRHYRATDSCNNISVCNHTITVADTIPPVLAGVPANAEYQCMSDVPATPTVTATDNCDTNLQVSVTSGIVGICPKVITIRWTVTDRCGNTTTSNQVITVRDTVRPILSCPADLIVPNVASIPACALSLAQFRALGGAASDNCDTDLEYHCVDGPLVGGNCGGVLLRTHTVIDDCLNAASCVQIINIATNAPPALTCPPNFQVECLTNLPACPTNLAQFIALGGAVTGSNLLYSCSDSPLIGNACGGVINRTHVVIDACTNITRCVQTITLRDTIPPTVACGQNLTVECGTQWTFDRPSAMDNCSGTNVSIIILSTSTNQLCGNTFAATRTWRAMDACTNIATCSQTITVVDTLPPVLACGIDLTIECGTTWEFSPPTAVDGCDGTHPVITVLGTVTNALCGNTYKVTRTYKATDACNNMSTNSQSITLVDTTPPALVCGAARTVECGTVWAFDRPSANDICDGTNVMLRVTGTITNALCGKTFSATRVWEAVDSCNNTSRCSQVVTVVDTLAPVLVGIPGDETFQCIGDVPAAPVVTATDLCDGANVQVSAISAIAINDCGYVISQSWTAVDRCSNSVTRSRTVTVRDTIAPQLVCAGNRSVECGTAWGFDLPSVRDNCDAAPALRVLTTVTNALCGRTFAATRTWEASDQCTNRATCSQTVTVVDTTPPILVGVPGNETFQCLGDVPAVPAVTATDSCDGTNVQISAISGIGIDGCGYVISQSWTAVDQCSNRVTRSRTVTVRDTIAPQLVCAGNRSVECGTAWGFDLPSVRDNCDAAPVLRVLSTVTNALCGRTFSATRTWEAVDQCSNTSRCSQVVIEVDTTPPVIACGPNLGVECGSAWAFTPPNASDLCDGTNLTLTVVSTVTNLTCGKTYAVTRTWKATDACTNSAMCSQTITLVDTQPPVIAAGTNFVIECGTAWSFTTPTATDLCDGAGVPVTIVTTTTNNTCGRTFIANRTYAATDACGNRATSSQTVTVIDTLPPVLLNVPASTNYECLPNVPPLPAVTAIDICDPNVRVTATSVTNGACPVIIIRTWKATDSCSNMVSASQIITVIERPPFLTQTPGDELICPGSNVTFCVTATNACPLTYQWFKGANALTGQSNNCLTITNAQAVDAGEYCVTVSSPCFSRTVCATLALRTKISVAQIPTPEFCIFFGTNLTICAQISGPQPYSIVWRKGTSVLANETNACLTFSNYVTANAGDYSVEVIGACNRESVNFRLPPPVMVCGANVCQALTNCVGRMARICETNFLVMPGVVYTFQWSKVINNLTNLIVNETNQCLTLPNVTAADAGFYVLTVTGTAGGVSLMTDFCGGTITVLTNLEPRALSNVAVCAGASAQFCTEAINAPNYPVAYQWYRNGQLLLNETNPCYSIASVSPEVVGQYCVVVKGSCNSVTNCGTLSLQGAIGDFVWVGSPGTELEFAL